MLIMVLEVNLKFSYFYLKVRAKVAEGKSRGAAKNSYVDPGSCNHLVSKSS